MCERMIFGLHCLCFVISALKTARELEVNQNLFKDTRLSVEVSKTKRIRFQKQSNRKTFTYNNKQQRRVSPGLTVRLP